MRRPAHVLSPRSLRGRLAWLVVFVTVPALALVAGLTKRAYDHERAAVGRHLLSTTRAVSLLVERKFEAAEALLHGFRAQPSLDQDDLTTFAAKIRPVLNNGDQWIVLLAPDGQQLINTRLPAGATLPVTQLGDDFWAAMRRGERFVSNVFTGTVVQAPVFSVSIPVLTPQGELKYALSFAMFPAALARAIAAEQITAGDIVVILDRQGVIATRSRNVERFAGQPARPQLIAASAARPEGVLESVTLEGIPTLSAFSRCSSLGWVAAIGAPRAALYASARKLLTHAALWTLVLIALTATGAAWIGRAVVHGMDGLIADTQQVGAGAVPPERKSGLREIDVVGDALRSSAAQLTGHARELRQLNQTLEARVQARTRELDASNRALVSANRELEEFARVASHDLREPLRSMMAFTEMLRDEHGPRLDAEGRRYVDRVYTSARRMSRLLEAILAYSKASAAPLSEFQTIDLKILVGEVEQDVSQRLKDTRGAIVTGRLDTVHGDARQLHQLLLNLISNGLKFHRADTPPRVLIESRRDDHCVHLTISDNGIGFDPAAAERIFMPFERLERNFEGSGIGLAIVRRVAERHGGMVRAASKPGEGSRFEVILPQNGARRS